MLKQYQVLVLKKARSALVGLKLEESMKKEVNMKCRLLFIVVRLPMRTAA